MLTGLRRVTKSGFIGFWRNAYVSLAAIYVITITLFVIASAIFLNQLLQHTLNIIQERVDINVYFERTAPQEEIDAVVQMIKSMDDVVSNVDYSSREEVLANYRERNQKNKVALQALEALDDNPFGASLAISAKDVSHYESINRIITERKSTQEIESPQVPVIESINYNDNKESIESLKFFIDAFNKTSLVVMVALIIATVLITFNTISLAIYTSREEISIMRLVGASNMFIRGPFMVQGMMYGFVSGVVALLIVYPLLSYLGPRTESYFDGFNLMSYFIANFGEIFGTIVGIGIVLGLVSSILAVTRYLRV